jgi:predicted acyltransferase
MSEIVASVEQKLQRNIAVDAYRGLLMLLMLGEGLQFAHVAASFPGNFIWRILDCNQSHVEWVGMSLHDTIQPSFTFLVGVALPHSMRSPQKKGASFQRMLGHPI